MIMIILFLQKSKDFLIKNKTAVKKMEKSPFMKKFHLFFIVIQRCFWYNIP